jgi:hypothetical protein
MRTEVHTVLVINSLHGSEKLIFCLRRFRKGFRTWHVTAVLQRCYSSVTAVLQRCYSDATVVLQRCYSGVTAVFQWCYSDVYSGVYSGVTAVLQRCHSGVTAVLQRCYSKDYSGVTVSDRAEVQHKVGKATPHDVIFELSWGVIIV